jgi:hypothetical protein
MFLLITSTISPSAISKRYGKNKKIFITAAAEKKRG